MVMTENCAITTKVGNESSYSFLSPNLSENKSVQSSNEKTPKSKYILSHSNPSNFSCGDESSRVTHFKLSATSPSFTKAQFSTPKNSTSSNQSKVNSNNCTDNDFSITNPFENQSTIDSLLQPSFSPSVFGSVTNNMVNESVNKSPGSFWNIDQIAIMKPTDIDLSKFHEQQNIVKLDPAAELKAQKAIDNFFANGINITSPWSSSDHPHYLAIISPAVPTSSSRKNVLHRRRETNTTPSLAKNVTPVCGEAQHGFNENNHGNTISTQTTLTIPPTFDLTKVLGQFFTYNDDASNKESNEVLSNSSLRRKLFFQDFDENSEVCFEATTSCTKDLQGVGTTTKSEDLDAFPMSGDSEEKEVYAFAKENMLTPLLKSKYCKAKTPSICQSPFSSSPVSGGRMFDLGTPYQSRCNETSQHSSNLLSPGAECSPIVSNHKPHNRGSTTRNHCGRKLCKNFALHEQAVLDNHLSTSQSADEKKMHETHLYGQGTSVLSDTFEQMSPPLSPIADVFEPDT